MYQAHVEIYSDVSNYAVMRHPGRNYPGILVQGDSLSILCHSADEVRQQFDNGDIEEALGALDEVRTMLWDRLNHYKAVLADHGLDSTWCRDGPNPPIIDEDADED